MKGFRKFVKFMMTVDALNEALRLIIHYEDKLEDISFEMTNSWEFKDNSTDGVKKYNPTISGDEKVEEPISI